MPSNLIDINTPIVCIDCKHSGYPIFKKILIFKDHFVCRKCGSRNIIIAHSKLGIEIRNEKKRNQKLDYQTFTHIGKRIEEIVKVLESNFVKKHIILKIINILKK